MNKTITISSDDAQVLRQALISRELELQRCVDTLSLNSFEITRALRAEYGKELAIIDRLYRSLI